MFLVSQNVFIYLGRKLRNSVNSGDGVGLKTGLMYLKVSDLSW